MLPNFFIAENGEYYKDGVFIIGTRIPYPMAQVFRFNTPDQLATFETTTKKKFARIPGYYAALAHYSNMDPNTPPKACSITVLQEMAQFFLRTRIRQDLSYWKRYAEKPAP
jgi:hypothetical protein